MTKVSAAQAAAGAQSAAGTIAFLCVVGVFAAVPVIGSVAVERGFMVPKLALAVLLAAPAFAASLAAGNIGSMRLDLHARVALAAMAAFVLVASLSAIWSAAPAAAFYGTQFRREGLLSWIACGMFFTATVLLARAPGRMRQLSDAFVIGSVIPAAYALQQRLGLDFYVFVISDPERVNGSFGNPNFLAAYLAMALVPTLARVMTSGFTRWERLPWGLLALCQCAAIYATQSRGPVLALLVAGFVFAACLLARRGAWRGVAWLSTAPVALVAAMLVINLFEAPRQWAQHQPFLQRLVFEPGSAATERTQASSRSIEIRFGLWQAGRSALAEMKLGELLIGRGPDLAYERGYRHLPESVMHLEGYWAVTNYDRLHADVYDIVLNYGILGWLAYWAIFCLALHGGARAMFGDAAAGPAIAWCAVSLLAAACGAFAAWQLFAAFVAPAFGLGAAAGWIAMLARAAWRFRGLSAVPGGSRPDWQAFAIRCGLAAALLVYWLDAQINVPILTTRLMAFAAAAVLIAAIDDPPAWQPDADANVLAAATGLALISAFISFVSVLTETQAESGAAATSAWRPALPMLAASGFALLVFAVAPRSGLAGGGPGIRAPRGETARARTIWIFWGGAALVIAVSYLMLRVSWSMRGDDGFVWGLRVAVLLPLLVLPVLCVVMGGVLGARRTSDEVGRHLNGAALAIIGGALCLGSGIAVARLIDAEVMLHASQWVNEPRPTMAMLLREQAVRRMPEEREFHRRRVFGLLEPAMDRIRRAERGFDWVEFSAELGAAEAAGQEALARFPDDPWVMLALCNVLQVRSLSALRRFDPVGGDRAYEDARALFERARIAFPVQPQVYRNWAQLEHDRGNFELADALLDRMEAIIPAQAEPYVERIVMARARQDSGTISAALARARSRLPPELLAQVLRVANPQQNE